jgi:hypothetical protein
MPKKLMALIREINALPEEKDQRLKKQSGESAFQTLQSTG